MDDLLFARALAFARSHQTEHAVFDQDRVVIGRHSELDAAKHAELAEYLQAFAPWRKGPFEIFGQRIDANWKCDLKWARVLQFAEPLAGRRVCDVGTGNGYYLFRMAAERPAFVLGLDPTIAFQRCFEFLRGFLRESPELSFSATGFEELARPEHAAKFDTIFCLGIVYHHTDPIRLLRILHAALRPGGQLIVESLGLPDSTSTSTSTSDRAIPVALTPAKGRYGGGGGNWHVPNALCLEQWLRRSGFRDVAHRGEYDFADEQVRTEDLPGLRDALDAQNPSLTVEGYPAPVRIYFSARR